MPLVRLRKRLLSRVKSDLVRASELGLAFLMTAGVAGCGGQEQVGTEGGTGDGAGEERPTGIEAAQFEGGHVEAAQMEGGIAHEAAQFEGGTMDDGSNETGIVIEAAIDGGKSG